MAQAALPFDSVGPVEATLAARPSSMRRASHDDHGPLGDRLAFEIGRDFARHRLVPPPAHLQAESAVLRGWHAGRAAFGARTLRATPAVRTWLQLRLTAWMHGRVFEEVQVTPNFLQHIEADQCPVARTPLTRGSQSEHEAVVERVCSQAAYAAGNLATLSRRVVQAKADLDGQAALARAERIDAEGLDHLDGLTRDEWRRLGVLMSLTTRLPHEQALALPLHVLPPNRLRVLNPVQALQVQLTRLFLQPNYARRMVALAACMPSSMARQAYQVFMHTMLARRLATKPAADAAQARRELEDLWADPLVMRRWQRLALSLSEGQCEALLRRAEARGMAATGSRWLPAERATEGWALECGGRRQSTTDELGTPGATVRPTPGSLRSTGSQKLASCVADTVGDPFQ